MWCPFVVVTTTLHLYNEKSNPLAALSVIRGRSRKEEEGGWEFRGEGCEF